MINDGKHWPHMAPLAEQKHQDIFSVKKYWDWNCSSESLGHICVLRFLNSGPHLPFTQALRVLCWIRARFKMREGSAVKKKQILLHHEGAWHCLQNFIHMHEEDWTGVSA